MKDPWLMDQGHRSQWTKRSKIPVPTMQSWIARNSSSRKHRDSWLCMQHGVICYGGSKCV